MVQLTLNGEIAIHPTCPFCGVEIRQISTEAYMNYLKRVGSRTARCPNCEANFLQIVFQLTDEQAERLREKWVKNYA